MNRLKQILIVVIILLIGYQNLLNSETQAVDTTIYVDDDNVSGPWDGSKEYPFKEITDAYNLVGQHGIIFVYNGSYFSNLIINKSISLIGEEKTSCIINGSNKQYTLKISATNVNITGFTIENSIIGLALTNASNVTISKNNFKNNNIGLNIDTNSHDNLIFSNNFLKNNLHAQDWGNNTWDAGYPLGGNYWDNYTGLDQNNDGIGDNPYLIPGGNSKDLYPMMKPITLTPQADFGFTPSHPYSIDPIQFIDMSIDQDGGIAMWFWDFGDGCNATIKDPTHTYFDDGKYIVTLIVSDVYGVTDQLTKTINVINVEPTPAFNYSPVIPTDLDMINFSDFSSDVDGTVVFWDWDFGDGNTSQDKDTSHRYADNGTYIVRLRVTDDDGAMQEIAKQVTILNVAPVVQFSFFPRNPTINDTIQFYDATIELDGKIMEWSWNFGDGTTSTEPSPSHQYINGGKYTITLSVVDNDEASSFFQKDVVIFDTSPGETDPGISILLYSMYFVFFIVMIVLVLFIKKKFG